MQHGTRKPHVSISSRICFHFHCSSLFFIFLFSLRFFHFSMFLVFSLLFPFLFFPCFLLFCCSFFPFSFFLFFQSSEQTSKPTKNRRKVPCVKMMISFRFLGLGGQVVRNGPFEGNPAFMFFIFPIFVFSRETKKVLLSFKHISLLSSESQFNHTCFLRSRDDIGRDSWDWVEPPNWEKACSPPEWGGGPSPVKTEPLQIVSVLL